MAAGDEPQLSGEQPNHDEPELSGARNCPKCGGHMAQWSYAEAGINGKKNLVARRILSRYWECEACEHRIDVA